MQAKPSYVDNLLNETFELREDDKIEKKKNKIKKFLMKMKMREIKKELKEFVYYF